MPSDSAMPVMGTTYQCVLGVVINSLRSSREPPVKQAELAEHLGLTVSTWSRIERGESSLTLEQLLGVALFFKIPLSDLLSQTEKVVSELAGKGVEVAVSRDVLVSSAHTMPLTNTQILAMLSPLMAGGPIGWVVSAGIAAYNLLKQRKG